MPALKEISSFKVNLANSRLAQSPLWDTQANAIIPAQLVAFKARLGLEGFSETKSLFLKIATALSVAEMTGELTGAPILGYSEPKTPSITSQALREGFEKMTRPMPAAILFALETGLSPDELASLTWGRAKELCGFGAIRAYARLILNSQPRHIGSDYVFWQEGSKGLPEPLWSMELEVFDAFEMVWAELQVSYRGMILNCGM